jgi:hypothetical protein
LASLPVRCLPAFWPRGRVSGAVSPQPCTIGCKPGRVPVEVGESRRLLPPAMRRPRHAARARGHTYQISRIRRC